MVFPFKTIEDFKIDLDQDHELLRTLSGNFWRGKFRVR